MNRLDILYRGSLSSCNYSCGYCPFAKTNNSREELRADEAELTRFVDWAQQTPRQLGILFTPWGEAIVHAYYRRAMIRLSHFANVHRVALQTNLSAGLDDFADADLTSLAFWATFHPSQTSVDRFVARCETAQRIGIRFSVGVVGLHEHFEVICELRERLPEDLYLWVNAFKRVENYYSAEDVAFLRDIDPYFDWNRERHPSLGRPCGAGNNAITVDGDGDIRRCHFVEGVLGNLYRDELDHLLVPSLCPNATCGCHIGYVHRSDFRLSELYGTGLLERIPDTWPNRNELFTVRGASSAAN